MKKLTAYRVSGNIIEDMFYSKVFYIDESQFTDQEDLKDAIEEMALEDWCEGEEWNQEAGDIFDGFTINEIKRIN